MSIAHHRPRSHYSPSPTVPLASYVSSRMGSSQASVNTSLLEAAYKPHSANASHLSPYSVVRSASTSGSSRSHHSKTHSHRSSHSHASASRSQRSHNSHHHDEASHVSAKSRSSHRSAKSHSGGGSLQSRSGGVPSIVSGRSSHGSSSHRSHHEPRLPTPSHSHPASIRDVSIADDGERIKTPALSHVSSVRPTSLPAAGLATPPLSHDSIDGHHGAPGFFDFHWRDFNPDWECPFPALRSKVKRALISEETYVSSWSYKSLRDKYQQRKANKS